jgi:hypothetical protein
VKHRLECSLDVKESRFPTDCLEVSKRAGKAVRRRLRGVTREFVNSEGKAIAMVLAGYALLCLLLVPRVPFAELRAFVQGALLVGVFWLCCELLRVPVTDVQRRGADAEVWTSKELRKATAGNWVVLDDVPFEKRNIDHVVIGATGVFAVETKYSSYLWRERPATPALKDALDQAKWGARKIRLYLHSRHIEVDVTPAIVVWGKAARGLSGSMLDGVLVLRGKYPDTWSSCLESVAAAGDVPVSEVEIALKEFIQQAERAEKIPVR